MELDDLRRQWQRTQPATDPPALNSSELRQLLAQKSSSTIAKLRRNARVEMALNYGILAIAGPVAALAPMLGARLFAGLLGLVAVVCIFYFRRNLGLLRSMSDPAADLREHLLRLTSGLRLLIRFYYRLTLAMIPLTLLLMGVMSVTGGLKAITPTKVWLLAAGLTVLGFVVYLPIAHGTRRYLHWLYGQHLDRLEGQLRELDAAPVVG